jgi:hypothetical protein
VKLLDYHTVTDKDIFLLNLHGEDVTFDEVANDSMTLFFQICMQLNLLKFMRQREYRGTLATFKVMKSFNFHMKLDRAHSLGYGRTKIKLLTNDTLNITEILMAHDYYREPDTDNKCYLHELFFDFATGHREAAYAIFNYEV